MQKITGFCLLGIAIIVGIGCNKDSDAKSSGCVSRKSWKVSDVRLSAADYDTAVKLFNANHVSLDIYQPVQAYNDGPDSSGGFSHSYNLVPYINGLPLALDTWYAQFYNGKRVDNAYPFRWIPENNDTTATVSLAQIRKAVLDSKPDTYWVADAYRQVISHWNDSCLVAVLSYAQTARIDSNSRATDSLVKVWAVYGSGNLLRPVAFVTDPGARAVPIYYISFP